ncbi:hypothetical protein KY328_01690 [Candidatus Woesearchaeota archaeon]|nr:hypothetical protein [Candidatus Woesearchaeota archaeon]MBW3021609.1 hypothetical protein [Candidatus Woesearchaeota archaeon]
MKPYRKLWRLLGLIFPVLYFFVDVEWVLGVVGVFLVLFIVFDVYRLKNRNFNRKVFKKYDYLLKDSEREGVTSATWFLVATLLVVLFFPKNIAIIAVLFSVFGNVAAMFAGRLYGKFSLGYKNVEGSIGMLIVCVVIGLIAFFSGFIELGIMLVGAFAATLTELFTPGKYDNLTVAVVAALIMSLA